MRNRKAEWLALRGALGVFAVCVVIAALMLSTSNYFWREMNREYQTNFARFRDASRRYLAVDDEERIIEAQYPAFKALYARGIIGREHRLSWVESLREAGVTLQVPKIDYRIDAQQVYVPEMALATGPFDIFVSAMKLSLGLLHEGDLARVLTWLDSHSAGLFSVERCELRREAGRERIASADLAAQLHAECLLRWYTLDQRGDAKINL